MPLPAALGRGCREWDIEPWMGGEGQSDSKSPLAINLPVISSSKISQNSLRALSRIMSEKDSILSGGFHSSVWSRLLLPETADGDIVDFTGALGRSSSISSSEFESWPGRRHGAQLKGHSFLSARVPFCRGEARSTCSHDLPQTPRKVWSPCSRARLANSSRPMRRAGHAPPSHHCSSPQEATVRLFKEVLQPLKPRRGRARHTLPTWLESSPPGCPDGVANPELVVGSVRATSKQATTNHTRHTGIRAILKSGPILCCSRLFTMLQT